VPELLASDIAASTAFWRDRLGFAIAYQRPEQSFVYLKRPEGAQLMLCQRSGNWETGALDPPFGRGVMFQVYVASIEPIQHSLQAASWPLFAGPREVWHVVGDREAGQREVFVQDPDEYLVMIAHDLGERPLAARSPARCCRKRTPMRSAGARPRPASPPSSATTSFRATGITAYLKNGGTLEKAAAMANHASTRTTQLYDRRRDELSLDEVERIII